MWNWNEKYHQKYLCKYLSVTSLLETECSPKSKNRKILRLAIEPQDSFCDIHVYLGQMSIYIWMKNMLLYRLCCKLYKTIDFFSSYAWYVNELFMKGRYLKTGTKITTMTFHEINIKLLTCKEKKIMLVMFYIISKCLQFLARWVGICWSSTLSVVKVAFYLNMLILCMSKVRGGPKSLVG